MRGIRRLLEEVSGGLLIIAGICLFLFCVWNVVTSLGEFLS